VLRERGALRQIVVLVQSRRPGRSEGVHAADEGGEADEDSTGVAGLPGGSDLRTAGEAVQTGTGGRRRVG
jgi:hypothetical protein